MTPYVSAIPRVNVVLDSIRALVDAVLQFDSVTTRFSTAVAFYL